MSLVGHHPFRNQVFGFQASHQAPDMTSWDIRCWDKGCMRHRTTDVGIGSDTGEQASDARGCDARNYEDAMPEITQTQAARHTGRPLAASLSESF